MKPMRLLFQIDLAYPGLLFQIDYAYSRLLFQIDYAYPRLLFQIDYTYSRLLFQIDYAYPRLLFQIDYAYPRLLFQIDYAYPPLLAGGEVNSSEAPPEWKHLASLAIPDGAHNYTKGRNTQWDFNFQLFTAQSNTTLISTLYNVLPKVNTDYMRQAQFMNIDIDCIKNLFIQFN